MRDRVRNAFVATMVVLMCCGGLLILAAVKIAAQHYPLVAMVVVGTGYAARRVVHTIRARRTARRLGIEGWRPAPIDQPWPWLPLSERPDQIRVHRAWARTVDRFPLTVGEITWNGNALHGSVPDWQGRGVFVVVQLPVPVEPMALRRPHRTIGTARRLDAPELHAAYEANQIPPWTADRDLLFTFHVTPGRMRPGEVQAAVRRTLLVVRLLDLDPVRPGRGSPVHGDVT